MERGRIHHMSATIRYARMQLDSDKRNGKPQLMLVDAETGPVSYDEAYAHLDAEEAAGIELFPVGTCDNRVEDGGCQGHDE